LTSSATNGRLADRALGADLRFVPAGKRRGVAQALVTADGVTIVRANAAFAIG
jgi:hypothetical protein